MYLVQPDVIVRNIKEQQCNQFLDRWADESISSEF